MSTLFNTRNPLTLGGMDALLAENKTYFASQVALFQPTRSQKDIDREAVRTNFTIHDTLITTRIRPLLEHEKEMDHIAGVFARGRDDYADVHELRNKVTGRPAINTSSFQFDRTYGPDATSDVIYEDLLAPLVPWAWSGGISTLFAYGQTGSGKTFTVDALAKKAAEHLFEGGLEGQRDVYLSCFELAGNVAFDLLNDKYTIKVLEDSFGETQLVGALEPRVQSAKELLSLIEDSMSFRKSAPTLKNDTSSRTHAVCRIKIVNKNVAGTPDGLLFLIDLAGSEAASDTRDHTQERMKETREINTSLSILKDCIRGRSIWHIQESQAAGTNNPRVQQAHIPFRSSTLTKVLKHVFDTKGSRHCKTSVIACVGSSYHDAASAKNTFRYAELLSVPVPGFKPPVHHDKVPTTWKPEFLKGWIERNSGTPSINPLILAPTESGIQLCRLPTGEFISRCLKTPSIDEQHARAFHEKLIGLHIDSRKISLQKKPTKTASEIQLAAEARAKAEREKPFVQRLRAGMFVQLRPIHPTQEHVPIFMILSPEAGFGGMYFEGFKIPGHRLEEGEEGVKRVGFGKGKRYICAEVAPAPMVNTYEIDVRRQNLIAIDEMETELLMDYDRATRYYYRTV